MFIEVRRLYYTTIMLDSYGKRVLVPMLAQIHYREGKKLRPFVSTAPSIFSVVFDFHGQILSWSNTFMVKYFHGLFLITYANLLIIHVPKYVESYFFHLDEERPNPPPPPKKKKHYEGSWDGIKVSSSPKLCRIHCKMTSKLGPTSQKLI